MRQRHFRTLGAALFGAFILAACSNADEGLTGPDGTIQAPGSPAFAVDGTVELGEFEVCKTYVGAVGPAVTVDYTVDYDADGSVEISGSIQLADGECGIVHTYDESNSNSGTQIQRVSVTEQVPTGYTAEYQLTTKVGFTTSVGAVTSGNSVTADMSSNQPDNGFLLDFINTEIPVVRGGQGCTPGYWKQDQHFDSWTSPLDPFDLFTNAGFTSPGSDARFKRGHTEYDIATQLDALRSNQGDLAALTRHAMAALLNAASADVSYQFSASEIVQMYNDAVAGTLDVETTKNLFDYWNNGPDGCPIN